MANEEHVKQLIRGRKTLMRQIVFSLSMVPVLLFAVVKYGQAAPMLDQQALPSGFFTVGSGIGGGIDKAQTFTVGISGTLLEVDVALILPGNQDLLFDIRSTISGVPIEDDTTTLASVTIPASQLSLDVVGEYLFPIDLTSFGLSVIAGDVLAIALRSPDAFGTAYSWLGIFGDEEYPRGSPYFRNPLAGFNTWNSDQFGVSIDHSFRTYVGNATDSAPNESPILIRESGVVPEPSTLLLLGTGGLVALAFRKAKKR